MAYCQTYSPSSHFRHPWFDTTVMKRKHRDIVSPDNEDSLLSSVRTAHVEPSSKRRRADTLETGFAHLSLNSRVKPVEAPLVAEHPIFPQIDEYYSPLATPMDTDSPNPFDHVQSYTVEEPMIPEFNMKTLSWYEPEPDRIVITDLDSFNDSDEEGEKSMTVNPALLGRLRNKTLDAVSPPPRASSQALVLFKPLPHMKGWEEEQAAKAEKERKMAKTEVDENAMEVEPDQ